MISVLKLKRVTIIILVCHFSSQFSHVIMHFDHAQSISLPVAVHRYSGIMYDYRATLYIQPYYAKR